jgi:acyl carrier protein
MRSFESIAAEFFKLPEAAIADTLTPKEVPEWDSMQYLLFIAEVEKEFSVSLTMDEVLSAQKLGDVRQALRTKGAPV